MRFRMDRPAVPPRRNERVNTVRFHQQYYDSDEEDWYSEDEEPIYALPVNPVLRNDKKKELSPRKPYTRRKQTQPFDEMDVQNQQEETEVPEPQDFPQSESAKEQAQA